MTNAGHTDHTRPTTYMVAMYSLGYGYGGGYEFQNMEEAERKAAELMGRGYKEVHIVATTKRVFVRKAD